MQLFSEIIFYLNWQNFRQKSDLINRKNWSSNFNLKQIEFITKCVSFIFGWVNLQLDCSCSEDNALNLKYFKVWAKIFETGKLLQSEKFLRILPKFFYFSKFPKSSNHIVFKILFYISAVTIIFIDEKNVIAGIQGKEVLTFLKQQNIVCKSDLRFVFLSESPNSCCNFFLLKSY